MSKVIETADAHTKPVEHWTTWSGAKAIRGERVLRISDAGDGYTVEVYDTGKMYTLRVYYWGHTQDASKEGYMFDWRCTGSDWRTVCDRGAARGLTQAAIAHVESEADDADLALR